MKKNIVNVDELIKCINDLEEGVFITVDLQKDNKGGISDEE